MKALGLSKCPVVGCLVPPQPWLCPDHWPLVTSEVRRRIVAETKRLSGRGVKDVPAELRELLMEAIGDIAQTRVSS